MFFSRKRRHSNKKTQDLEKQIEELKAALQQVKGRPIEYHIHIDHVTIKEPSLEQLTFQLDQLDIEELSGALNLGNNFGVHVKPKDSSAPRLRQTNDGLKFTFPSKEE
ncbi:hypothetical protein GLW04_09985 [Halobacillus litoralis]|uniref:Uncharacterized protein n=1 Tax=Halobacillus litoralis TaxID=45668 RepID=A0A845DS45_9BACI|nr:MULTISPECIES: hypothetical protein [Halobacillus]MYL20216.1 hypothetical protein [Halobacillus litoralis]MYL29310.1 hypothetical protein [Halobacillus halophilus]